MKISINCHLYSFYFLTLFRKSLYILNIILEIVRDSILYHEWEILNNKT